MAAITSNSLSSPGRPGNLKFKCLLWSNCPLYERVRQDQSFIFSPETLNYAPQSMRNKLSAVPGIDGVFLKPRPAFYLNNFLAFRKRSFYVLTPEEKEKAKNGIVDSVISLPNLEFLALEKDSVSNELVLDGTSAVDVTARAAHQTWIADGSLYCSENVLPSEVDSIQSIKDTKTRVIRSLCTAWHYVFQSNILTFTLNGNNDLVKDNTSIIPKFTYSMPTTLGIHQDGDPAALLKNNEVDSDPYFRVANQENVYRNINPGMHWRLLKRTSLFQGEDFTVEFVKKAFTSVPLSNPDDKYRMLDRFKFLDPFALGEGPLCGSLNADGLWDKDANNEIVEASRKVFDFSRQIYYMIEIGIGDPDHNYMIIIAENSFPIFCHIGKTPYLSCNLESTGFTEDGPPIPASGEGSPPNCDTDVTGPGRSYSLENFEDNPLKEVTVVENPEDLILRKLSIYDGASSSTLLQRDKLRMMVRQHGGNIIVTFAGYEDRPWVISRKDINPNSTPVGQPVTESQINYDSVRMKISSSQMAVMGGNMKCSLTFAPLIYEEMKEYKMPQPFSVQGPVDVGEIQFLLRDKGKSKNPQVSISQSSDHFTNEATLYYERIFVGNPSTGKVRHGYTYASGAQPEFFYKYGKAPEMADVKYWELGVAPSTIDLNASECVSSAGSSANTSKLMQASLSMTPGDYMFESPDGASPWLLKSCVTPILYYFRMYVAPKGCIFKKSAVDVSKHVTAFSDEWSETDWQKLEHQGSISFLISEGMKFAGNQSKYLASLVDKAFYLQISLWWEDGIMPVANADLDKVVFTGFCPGGTIVTETNKKILDCKLFDYSAIIKDQKFFNSPFFDRMRDVNAIQEILQLSGLRSGEDNKSTLEPGSLVRILADTDPEDEWYSFFFNGEKLFTREFALPGSYDILQSPFMRFTDGQSFWDAITRISELSNKVAYFDRLGVFNFVALPYDQELFGGQQGMQTNWSVQDWLELSKVDFFATPRQYKDECHELHRQIIGDYRVERVVQDVVNEIKVITTTPNGEILVAGHVNYASLHDPDSPGFLGYHKPFLQMDGIFGNEATVKWMVKNYTRMFIPPIKVSFRAIGRNNIKALDVISFQPLGSTEKQPLIVSSVKSEVDASKNTWFQDFECLWLFPRQDIQWGNTSETALGLDGGISTNVR